MGMLKHEYYTYVLLSKNNGDIYVGRTGNLRKRLALHNSGQVRSTKPYRPWILLESRQCNSRSESVRLERFLKTGQQKELLKEKYK